MPPAPTRRARREAEKKKSGARWAAAGAIAFLAVGGGGLFLVTQTNGDASQVPSSCESTQRVSVVTEQSMADVLAEKPVEEDSCVQLDVTVEPSARTATRAAADELSQPLWIPDSSRRLPSSSFAEAVTVHTESLASSPGVIVAEGEQSVPATWTAALAQDSIRMGNPERDGGALTALLAVSSEVSSGEVTQTDAAAVLTPRAQTQGVNSPILAASEMLGEVQDAGGQAIVSERDYLSYRQENGGSADPGLTATVPDSGAAFLDYPLLASENSLENNEAVRAAADEIAEWLASDDGREALAEANLRDSDGDLASASAVDVPGRLEDPDTDVWDTISESYRNQAAPLNALVALDASGSMGTVEANGLTRWDATAQTLMLGSQLFPARDSMGLWIFSDDMTDEGLPYREVVPTRGMEEGVDGQTQRELLQAELAATSYKPGGQTELYETALAAFRSQQENYKDGQLNMVLLVSDGKQEFYTGESMSLDEVVTALEEEQDPTRPVVIVSLGISPDADADALGAIAQATGGSYHPATTPEELQAAFVEALSADDPAAQQGQ